MLDRYSKQRIFLGRAADEALRSKRVAVLGLGALGSVIAPWLARAGVGHLTLIDRDLVEASNLQRQLLYDESDLGGAKAEVAAKRLAEANSSIQLNAVVADLTSGNARELLADFDLICDGTDNFEARFLINDVAILTGTPWIYAGAIGGEGVVWPLNPPRTPCLRCLLEEPPGGRRRGHLRQRRRTGSRRRSHRQLGRPGGPEGAHGEAAPHRPRALRLLE